MQTSQEAPMERGEREEEESQNKKAAKQHKSLKLYVTNKLKKLPNPKASRLLSACNNPRTPSFSLRRGDGAAGLPAADDVDRPLADKFRSLHLGPGGGAFLQPSGSSKAPPDRDGGAVAAAAKAVAGASGGGVAVMTFSVEPYDDFRGSMRAMAKARRAAAAAAPGAAPAVDWDFMEEMLFCFLQLNDRAVHKDILRAFTDTVAELRCRQRAPARRRPPPSPPPPQQQQWKARVGEDDDD